MEEGTRTQTFYDDLKNSGRSDEEVAQVRSRLSDKTSEEDNFTGYFVHEAQNAFGIIQMYGEAGLAVEEDDYESCRTRLIHAKQGLDWFKHNGPISQGKIVEFLDEVEGLGSWNADVFLRAEEMYKNLMEPYEEL